MRNLKSFNVCNKIACAFSVAAICWGGSIRTRDSKKIKKLIRKASSVLGTALEPLELTVERKMLQKPLTLLDNRAHPLHNPIQKQLSFFIWRLIQLHCNKDHCNTSVQ